MKRVTDIMAEIIAASQEQSAGIEQVNQAVGQMDGGDAAECGAGGGGRGCGRSDAGPGRADLTSVVSGRVSDWNGAGSYAIESSTEPASEKIAKLDPTGTVKKAPGIDYSLRMRRGAKATVDTRPKRRWRSMGRVLSRACGLVNAHARGHGRPSRMPPPRQRSKAAWPPAV